MPFGKKKPIIIKRPNGEEVEYPSQSSASRFEPVSQSDISEMCRLGVKQKGFRAWFKPDQPKTSF